MHRKYNKNTLAYFLFEHIDFIKAFDSFHRESLWEVAKLYGIPGKYIRIYKALYDNSRWCIQMSNR